MGSEFEKEDIIAFCQFDDIIDAKNKWNEDNINKDEKETEWENPYYGFPQMIRLESKEELLLDDHKGAVVETVAVSELLKKRYNDAKKANLTYYRDKNGFEVDIITDWKKNFAIEVKSKSDVEKKLSSSVKTYVGLRSDSVQGSVFYLGDISCEINGIKYIPWNEWGM